MQKNNETTGFFAPLAQDDVPASVGQPGKASMPPQNDAASLRHPVQPFRHPAPDAGSISTNVAKKPGFFARTSRPQNDVHPFRHPEFISGSQSTNIKAPLTRISSIRKAQAEIQPSPARGEGKQAAFTLAEVLITLGIIGIVAAMTMPMLIRKYTNNVVETRLKVFYSQVNEAIRLSEAEYGDKKDWFIRLDGSEGYSYTDRDEWFQTYIGKHIKIVKKELNVPFLTSGGGNIYYLSNGSAFGNYQSNNSDWVFFPGNPQKCLKLSNSTSYVSHVGKCAFLFNFSPNSKNPNWQFTYNKGVEPWKYSWDGEESTLKTGCATGTGTSTRGYYCAALIQYNNWTIPKDYPHPVSY